MSILLEGVDCLEGLRRCAADSVDLVVTSPPYWGQRGDAGIGLEESPFEYVDNVIARLVECLRVLKPSGVLFLNVGDAYNTPINWTPEASFAYSSLGKNQDGLTEENAAHRKKRGRRRTFPGVPYGMLLGLPWRIVLGLCDRGALFRGEIIWRKTRPLPEGLCRRPHRRHEGIYLLAKTEQHSFRVKPPVGSVWEIYQRPGDGDHDSPFPEDLVRQCMEASGIPKGTLLDPFAGSGTSGVVAKRYGWDFLGFEIDTERASRARERIDLESTPTLNVMEVLALMDTD